MGCNRDTIDLERINPDPITGEHGAHPVGVGVGAAGMGLTAAAIAAVGGPVAAMAGAAFGAVAGGLLGKAAAEEINPTVEDEYWQEHYTSRPYVRPGSPYAEFQSAYRHGWLARIDNPDRAFHEVEPELRAEWERADPPHRLSWDLARPAVVDAWERLE